MEAVNQEHGRMFFLYGYGGTGKTHMWRTLTYALRSQKQILLQVVLLRYCYQEGEQRSKFKIPVPNLENSLCNIHQGSELVGLLKQTKLIIWDEAPMSHKFCFEALDKSLGDIMGTTTNDSIIFGGKQILPLIPKGCRSDIVHATINSSYLWHYCTILNLTKNMRLQNDDNTTEIREFSEWILKVGDGKLLEPNDGCELLILHFDNPIEAIVSSTYPDLHLHYNDEQFLQCRAILASTIDIVDQINEYVLSIIPGEEKEYLSSDSVDMSDVSDIEVVNVLTPEFLNKLSISGIPNHKIKLKIGTTIMLLRNLDQSEGLCNGTRLIVTQIANHVLEAKIMSEDVTVSLTHSMAFQVYKKTISYNCFICYDNQQISRTISLESVGLYLPKLVFSHGQLYVAISMVKSKKGLKILIHDKNDIPLKSTSNVVYKEFYFKPSSYFTQ
ncbi:hypothetical protein Lal_00024202 [Lupinus albus]|nr:hypothetical protein Lal_00024202 [Lupinus albus]